MGRPVKIHQIRRTTAGSDIVVAGMTGDFKWRYLSAATASQAASILKLNGLGHVVDDKDVTFTLDVDPDNPYKPVKHDNDRKYDPLPDDDGEYGEGEGDGNGDERDGDEGSGEATDPKDAFENPYDGDGQPKDGSGGGDDPDSPVLHRELPDIAQQVGYATLDAAAKVFVAAETFKATLTFVGDDVAKAKKAAADLNADLTAIEDRVTTLELNGGGSGGSGFIKIEVRTPTKVEIKEGLFHAQFPKLVRWVGSGNHVYLPGPPGTGKSHAAEQVAKTLGWRFGSISLGPTTPESRLWGGKDAHGNFHEPTFIELARYAAENPESGAVYCLDEMDNGHPGVIATMNSAMANGWFTAPNGDIISFGSNLVFVAAANTFGTGPTAEFAGRNKLDAATLDRFLYLPWDTDLNVEETLVRAHLAGVPSGDDKASDWLDVWRTARANVADNGLKVFVTMRGAINGAKLIAGGEGIRSTLDGVLLSKLPTDQAKKINPL